MQEPKEPKKPQPLSQQAPALPAYAPTDKLLAEPGQEWRYRRNPDNTPDTTALELVDVYGDVVGYKDNLGKYWKKTTPEGLQSYCPPEVIDLVIQGLSENKSLAEVSHAHSISVRQLRYWVKTNQLFREKYEDALWATGHYAWQTAEELAEELAEGVPHKPTADSKAQALGYYERTRDKLLKDEFMVKVKQEQTQDRQITVVFQSKAEYTDEDRARLAKEVSDLGIKDVESGS